MRSKIFFVFMVLFVGSGCTSGFVYTNVTFPLTTDMRQTPVGQKFCPVNSKHLQEPITGFDITVEWDSRAIADAVSKAGLETVYYADMHTISVLGGLWKQQTVCVCGK